MWQLWRVLSSGCLAPMSSWAGRLSSRRMECMQVFSKPAQKQHANLVLTMCCQPPAPTNLPPAVGTYSLFPLLFEPEEYPIKVWLSFPCLF